MGDIGKYIVIGGAVLIVAVIFLVIIKTRNGFVVLQNRVKNQLAQIDVQLKRCLLYTSPSPRDGLLSRMPSSA